MFNINKMKTRYTLQKNNDYSLIGMRREQPIGWIFKKLFKPYGIEVITNPYIYDDYVRQRGKGCDIEIPDLGIAIELKGLSKYLSNGKRQYINKNWLIIEVTGGKAKHKGEMKDFTSRYPEGYIDNYLVFQYGSVCSQNLRDWLNDTHNIETLSPNVDLDHIWDNKHDFKKLRNFIYSNFFAPYKGQIMKIKKLREKYGNDYDIGLINDMNNIRYNKIQSSSSYTRVNNLPNIIKNNNIIDNNLIKLDIIKDRYRLVDRLDIVTQPKTWAEVTGKTEHKQPENEKPRITYRSWSEY